MHALGITWFFSSWKENMTTSFTQNYNFWPFWVIIIVILWICSGFSQLEVNHMIYQPKANCLHRCRPPLVRKSTCAQKYPVEPKLTICFYEWVIKVQLSSWKCKMCTQNVFSKTILEVDKNLKIALSAWMTTDFRLLPWPKTANLCWKFDSPALCCLLWGF